MSSFTFPAGAKDLPKPRRIILHWTGGAYRASSLDRSHYHALVEWLAEPARIHVAMGVPIANNLRQLSGVPSYSDEPTGYAAHTRGFNSWSLGFAVCAMLNAEPGDWGEYPILKEQVDGLITLCAQVSAVFGLEVSEDTFFTHYEADHLHGIAQAGKWDICAIPMQNGELLGKDEVGPWLREQIKSRL